MKATVLFCLTILLINIQYTNAQGNNLLKLNAHIGFEQRITPIYPNTSSSGIWKLKVFYNEHDQMVNSNLSIGLKLRENKLGFYFTYDFVTRYDHIYFDTKTTIQNIDTEGVYKSVKGLITDHILSIGKDFKVNDKVKIFLQMGFGFMNNGTEYAYSEKIDEFQGKGVYVIEHADFRFRATSFEAGINYEKLSLAIITYYDAERTNFIHSAIVLPGINVKYNFSLL